MYQVGKVLLGCALLFSTAAIAQERSATLYRDTWGVPHIYADSAADAAYALGYAQAQDRLPDIYGNFRTALGRMAEVHGESYVRQDYTMRLMRVEELSREHWNEADPHLKAITESFIRGIKAYEAEHPEKKPADPLELHPWYCTAIGRAMILRWPLGTVRDDLRNKHDDPGFGSNSWVVAPSRSADGSAILFTDPHLTWENLAVFYEARVHGGELTMDGFFIVGSPLMALGNNGKVGWASTTGGPDTADVYALKLNPQNPSQYEYDGQWENLEVKSFEIGVKDAEPVRRLAAYSRFGPLFEEPDLAKGVAYAGASPYFEWTDLMKQSYRMITAQNAEEFYTAIAEFAMMEQNIPFADIYGTTQYVRTGRTPIRPSGYDWNAPVPGNTSKTAWQGIHGVADMVQIKNPPQGYFQNCNISPENMMVGSPMKPGKYPDYIYNVSWDDENTRSRRAVQLLDGDRSVTKEEAMAYAMDVYDVTATEWQRVLKEALDEADDMHMQDASFAAAAKSILAWDGQFTPESTTATLVKFWRIAAHEAKLFDQGAVERGKPLEVADNKALLDALQTTIDTLQQRHGSATIPYGQLHQLGRGDTFVPVGGTDHTHVRTLISVSSRETPNGSGKYVAVGGSMSIMLMFFKPEGIEAYTCVMWGQSGDPASPHYMDQGEKLYSQRKLKPTWMKKEDLLNHLQSTTALTIP